MFSFIQSTADGWVRVCLSKFIKSLTLDIAFKPTTSKQTTTTNNIFQEKIRIAQNSGKLLLRRLNADNRIMIFQLEQKHFKIWIFYLSIWKCGNLNVWINLARSLLHILKSLLRYKSCQWHSNCQLNIYYTHKTAEIMNEFFNEADSIDLNRQFLKIFGLLCSVSLLTLQKHRTSPSEEQFFGHSFLEQVIDTRNRRNGHKNK